MGLCSKAAAHSPRLPHVHVEQPGWLCLTVLHNVGFKQMFKQMGAWTMTRCCGRGKGEHSRQQAGLKAVTLQGHKSRLLTVHWLEPVSDSRPASQEVESPPGAWLGTCVSSNTVCCRQQTQSTFGETDVQRDGPTCPGHQLTSGTWAAGDEHCPWLVGLDLTTAFTHHSADGWEGGFLATFLGHSHPTS